MNRDASRVLVVCRRPGRKMKIITPPIRLLTKSSRCDLICGSAMNSENKKFYLYYCTNSSVREISRVTFTKIKGKVMTFGNNYVRIVGLDDKYQARPIREGLKKFFGQSLSEWVSGLKVMMHGLGTLGKAAEFCESHKTMGFDIISICLDILRVMANPYSVIDVCALLFNFYKLVNTSNLFSGQSLPAVLMSAATLFMPKKIFEFFKNVTVFTNLKIMDDPSIFHEFLIKVFEYVEAIVEYLPLPASIKEHINKFFLTIKNYVTYAKFKRLLTLAQSVFDRPRLAIDPLFRNQYRLLINELNDDVAFTDWLIRSAYLKEGFEKCKRVMKIFTQYENAMRIEPACFIFEGMPGTMKSVVMNNVVVGLEESTYYHRVPAKEDGKDWYDSYNNEKLFVMDDVGQQGISQWRSLINMVSPVKLPLDCANADLKDTKFFSSEVILASTNKFMTLTGLTKDDCISEIDALWRRAFVFRFDVNRTSNLGDAGLVGAIRFFSYKKSANCSMTLGNPNFINEFPPDIIHYLREKGLCLPTLFECNNQPDMFFKLTAWMCDIISVIVQVKELQRKHNDIHGSISKVNSYRKFKGQGLDSPQGLLDMMFVMDEVFEEGDGDTFNDVEVIETNTPHIDPYFTNEEEIYPRVETLRVLDPPKQGCFKEFIQFLMIRVKELFKSYILDNVTILGVGALAIVVCVGVLLYLLLKCVCSLFKSKPVSCFVGQADLHPSVSFVAKQVFSVDVVNDSQTIQTYALVSGHCIILNAHPVIDKEVYITIYKDRSQNHRLIDHLKYLCVFRSVEDDVSVLISSVTMPTPFKNLSKHFREKQDRILKNAYLLNTEIKPLHTIRSNFSTSGYWEFHYKGGISSFVSQLAPKDIYYNEQYEGMCGSVIFDSELGVIGMHSAGNSQLNIGAAIFWSNQTQEKISSILKDDRRFLLNVDISPKVIPEFSGIKLDYKLYLNTPHDTKLIPSPIHGVFPITREPAQLSKFGKHTVKDVAKKSFKPIKGVDTQELKFGVQVLSGILDKYDILSEQEIVKGNKWLAGLNKDSSNGYHCKTNKSDYIDFEKGCFKDSFREEVCALEKAINDGDVSIECLIWSESLKDELRAISKDGVPRSFRVSTIHIQVLTKKYFGNLIASLMQTRDFHGICIGINPFKEWPVLYKALQACEGRIWANDIKSWDGSMLSQVQLEINNLLLSRYVGENPRVPEFILTTLVYCFVGMNDDLYITTHSMPSGSFLTAMYNSLVNKFYKAMWFYRYSPYKTVNAFYKYVVDFVYGDDTLNGTLIDIPDLNAITMKEFFESIGLSCTSSTKGEIVTPYQNIKDITFLKRSFKFHSQLGCIACPLDVSTIYSSISFLDSTKDADLVLGDKIHAFQREIYLHEDLYLSDIETLEQACVAHQVNFKKLPQSYIRNLYLDEPEEWKSLSYSSAKYM